jgi:hypothetical protein
VSVQLSDRKIELTPFVLLDREGGLLRAVQPRPDREGGLPTSAGATLPYRRLNSARRVAAPVGQMVHAALFSDGTQPLPRHREEPAQQAAAAALNTLEIPDGIFWTSVGRVVTMCDAILRGRRGPDSDQRALTGESPADSRPTAPSESGVFR